MNEEKFKNKIEVSIKTLTMREYLLGCLKNECTLNTLNSLAFLTENASQRFEKK